MLFTLLTAHSYAAESPSDYFPAEEDATNDISPTEIKPLFVDIFDVEIIVDDGQGKASNTFTLHANQAQAMSMMSNVSYISKETENGHEEPHMYDSISEGCSIEIGIVAEKPFIKLYQVSANIVCHSISGWDEQKSGIYTFRSPNTEVCSSNSSFYIKTGKKETMNLFSSISPERICNISAVFIHREDPLLAEQQKL